MGALRRVLWGALLAAEQVVLDPAASRADVLRAAHAIATVAGTYARVHEQTELADRIEAIEAVLGQRGNP